MKEPMKLPIRLQILIVGLLILISFIFSCTTKQVKTADLTGPSSALIFPFGKYTQKVTVNYIEDGVKVESSFNTVLVNSAQEISMYAYVGFGYTLFKLKDNLAAPPELSTTNARIEKHKEFFIKMYQMIKQVLALRKTDERLKNGEIKLLLSSDQFPVEITISSETLGLIPHQVVFANAEHFYLLVQNLDFSPLNN